MLVDWIGSCSLEWRIWKIGHYQWRIFFLYIKNTINKIWPACKLVVRWYWIPRDAWDQTIPSKLPQMQQSNKLFYERVLNFSFIHHAQSHDYIIFVDLAFYDKIKLSNFSWWEIKLTINVLTYLGFVIYKDIISVDSFIYINN